MKYTISDSSNTIHEIEKEYKAFLTKLSIHSVTALTSKVPLNSPPDLLKNPSALLKKSYCAAEQTAVPCVCFRPSAMKKIWFAVISRYTC